MPWSRCTYLTGRRAPRPRSPAGRGELRTPWSTPLGWSLTVSVATAVLRNSLRKQALLHSTADDWRAFSCLGPSLSRRAGKRGALNATAGRADREREGALAVWHMARTPSPSQPRKLSTHRPVGLLPAALGRTSVLCATQFYQKLAWPVASGATPQRCTPGPGSSAGTGTRSQKAVWLFMNSQIPLPGGVGWHGGHYYLVKKARIRTINWSN
jgi:hypothetical protein